MSPQIVGNPIDMILPKGTDQDLARSMWIQARNRRTPLTQSQVEHLLRIGIKAGRVIEAAKQRAVANPDAEQLATVRAHLELVESHARDAVTLTDALLNEGPTP